MQDVGHLRKALKQRRNAEKDDWMGGGAPTGALGVFGSQRLHPRRGECRCVCPLFLLSPKL